MIVQKSECIESTKIISGLYKISQEDLTGSKMQQQHIKRLIFTAATANGIVGDVDALPASGNQRNLWRLEEIHEVLNIMQQINALELLNDKTVKSEKVFRNIEQLMHRKGFRKKSHSQIWTKWKFLKSTYMTSRRNRIVPKMIPYEIYQVLHKMLNSSFGVSTGNSSTASLDGDNSNCGEDSSFNNTSIENNKTEQNELAHPIFGFRLGLVKSEPVDTGYETTANNSTISETDSLDETAAYVPPLSPSNSNGNITQESFLDIKEERVSDSPTPLSPSRDTPEEREPLLIPRNIDLGSRTEISRNDVVHPSISNPDAAAVMPSMPPLRIAPFANESNMKEAFIRLEQSPTSISSMNPLALIDTQNTAEENGTTFIQKMLRNSETDGVVPMPAPPLNSISSRPSILRLPKELTLQLRASDTDSSNPKRLKQSTTRQTAYSLRPERTGPSLNDVLPPLIRQLNQKPSLSINKDFTTTNQNLEQPMTSQMASKINAKLKAMSSSSTSHLTHKKRRLDIPSWNDQNAIHPTKITRSTLTSVPESEPQNTDCHDGSYRDLKNPASTLQSNQPESSSPEETISSTDSFRKQRALMEEMLKDLAMSLRQTQLEMVNNFFENQMQITRKEHEFQMKQDQLIMEAFQEQTRQLMTSACRIFGLAKKKPQTKVEKQAKKTGRNDESNKEQLGTKEIESFQNSDRARDGDKIWAERDESSSECLQNNDNLETAVDPTQYVTSELVEECDND